MLIPLNVKCIRLLSDDLNILKNHSYLFSIQSWILVSIYKESVVHAEFS